MSTKINQEYNKNTKSNLEIKLRNDFIALKKVLKWAKTIRNRIDMTLQQLDSSESKKQSLSDNQVIQNPTKLIEKLLEAPCSTNLTQKTTVQITRDQNINSKIIEFLPKSVKNVQIDFKNAEKIIESLFSKRLSSFNSRIDDLELKSKENIKCISSISNDLKSIRTDTKELNEDLKSIRTNINELEDDLNVLATQTDNIGTKINNVNNNLINDQNETRQNLEKIINFLQT